MADESTVKKQLVTDLMDDLNPDEINLLAKSPKFSLSNGINEDTLSELNNNFCNRIRWSEVTTPEAYPQSKAHL